jgi:acyl carrier protein
VGISSEALIGAVLARLRDAGVFQQASEEQIRQAIAMKLGSDGQSMPAGMSLADLGADSLDVVELVMALEEEFGIDLTLP